MTLNPGLWTMKPSKPKYRACTVCDNYYKPSMPNQKYCGRICAQKANNEAYREREKAKKKRKEDDV